MVVLLEARFDVGASGDRKSKLAKERASLLSGEPGSWASSKERLGKTEEIEREEKSLFASVFDVG